MQPLIDFNVAMDIETTGLDPWESRVVTAAFVGNKGDTFEVFDDADDEERLLNDIEHYVRNTRIDLLIGWNHTEFDLPFLAVRMVLNGIDLGPFVRPNGKLGKYQKPRYTGSWFGAGYKDIAYSYEKACQDAGIPWSLKALAKHKKLGPGIEVDFERTIPTGMTAPCVHRKQFGGTLHEYDPVYRNFTILDLDKQERELYCVSDAQLAMGLFLELPPEKEPKGQAVFLDGPVSIL